MATVQLGNSVSEDVENSFFVTMDNQTAMFADIVQKVRRDCWVVEWMCPCESLFVLC